MADFYRGGDRSQAFLLPPDVREWLPADHLAWLVIELVEAADTSVFHARSRRGGRGRAGFDPDVLVALLVYAYATGQRSSRRIEQACHTDVACRVITGNEAPDHTVIARFRQHHQDAFAQLFVDVLAVCAAEGMGQVGTIAIDGTKLAADASRMANRTRAQLREQIDQILAQAQTVDAAEDDQFGPDHGGEQLPGRLDPQGDRLARLQAAMDELEADHPAGQIDDRLADAQDRVDQLAHELAQMHDQRDHYLTEVDRGRRGPGQPRPAGTAKPPRPAWIARKQQALDNARTRLARLEDLPDRTGRDQPPRRNTTDPDSRLLRSQGSWIQGYNAQAAVSADGLIVACQLTNAASDTTMLVPMLDQLDTTLDDAGIDDPVRVVLADTGYFSADNLAAPGPPRLIPPPRHHRSHPAVRMRQRLDKPGLKSLYNRRYRVEQAFGRIKHNQHTTRLSRRGLAAANSEWNLICLTHNLLALHHHRRRRATP